MRWVVLLLAMALTAIYVLTASGAVEFKTTTIEKNEVMERAAAKPEFHWDRLTTYLEQKAGTLKRLPDQWMGRNS